MFYDFVRQVSVQRHACKLEANPDCAVVSAKSNIRIEVEDVPVKADVSLACNCVDVALAILDGPAVCERTAMGL